MLSQYQVGNAPLALPPPEEQYAIFEQVRARTRTLQTAIERATTEIQLLLEYRTRLIADVVKGKLDVRSVELPVLDEAEALEDWGTDEDTQADAMDEMEGVDA